MNLTTRQHEVLHLVSMGHPLKVVADKLGISVKTAETHGSAILRVLGAKNQAHSVAIAFRAGLLK